MIAPLHPQGVGVEEEEEEGEGEGEGVGEGVTPPTPSLVVPQWRRVRVN